MQVSSASRNAGLKNVNRIVVEGREKVARVIFYTSGKSQKKKPSFIILGTNNRLAGDRHGYEMMKKFFYEAYLAMEAGKQLVFDFSFGTGDYKVYPYEDFQKGDFGEARK